MMGAVIILLIALIALLALIAISIDELEKLRDQNVLLTIQRDHWRAQCCRLADTERRRTKL